MLAGWHDGFFLRDSKDVVRLYPRMLLQLDFNSSLGSGVHEVPTSAGAEGLQTRMVLRRLRLELGGELFKRWGFLGSMEMGINSSGNSKGDQETSAAKPGDAPTASSGKYAAVQSAAATVQLSDVLINYKAFPFLNFMVGQFNVPFGMELRTPDSKLAWSDRTIATRFATPSSKELGVAIWGELGKRVLAWEFGVFNGEGNSRPSVDSNADVIGRIFTRPLAAGATDDFGKFFQLGISAKHGDRDPKNVAYDYASMTTNQGFALWSPSYKDSLGRSTHILPSGAQNAIGGEARVRVDRFALQGEVIYVANNTREAIDGFQLTNTERLGRLKGIGWYGQLSVWPFGDPFINGEPGIWRPPHLDLDKPEPEHTPRGLELVAVASGVSANYNGATRKDSVADSKTPNADISIYQVGLGGNYWHTSHVKVGLYWMAYLTPGSGKSSDNLAIVPDNLLKQDDGKTPKDGHALHEISARMQVAF